MNNQYMLAGVILLILSMVPFFFMFEKKRPRAREVVLIAVMSSIAVVSNIVCAYTVPFHAGTAIIMVTGIALGPQAGFLTGTLASFICHFFMGQGAWTPWEMFAWGLIGIIGGVIFNKVEIRSVLDDKKEMSRIQLITGTKAILFLLAIIAGSELAGVIIYIFTSARIGEPYGGWWIYAFGAIGIIVACASRRSKLPVNVVTTTFVTFISVFVIYGGVMNLAILFMGNMITDFSSVTDTIKTLFITGAPYDAWHAVGASVCMILFGDGIIQKLERIKIKYGLIRKGDRP